MIRVPVEDEIGVFSHIVKTDLGEDNFSVGEVWHEPATYLSACSDLFIVNGPVSLLRIDWVVQFFR
jgi:hypothetical protein